MKDLSAASSRKSLLSAKESQERMRLKEKFPKFYSQIQKEIQFTLFATMPKVKKPKPRCFKCAMPLLERSCKLCVFSDRNIYSRYRKNSKDPLCATCYCVGHYSESCLLNDSPDRDFSRLTCLNCKKKGHANCMPG